MATCPSIDIGIAGKRMPLWRLLLTYGIRFAVPAGTTVSNFLLNKLPMDAAFLQNRVQTLFLDGQPIDRPDQAVIRRSCTISLSAAMPGLFGAAFRKNGSLGAMRMQTTPDGPNQDFFGTGAAVDVVDVTVKCFNDVAAALGDKLLARGVRIAAESFLRFWQLHASFLERDCRWVYMDGQPASIDAIPDSLRDQAGEIVITVTPVG